VETPLHAGTGSGLGVIDLPIQRERATGYPMIQASGIKGKLRAEAEEKPDYRDKIDAVFGPNTSASDHAGALAVGDGRILLFPVRSLMGVFAWVTSKAVLARFARDGNVSVWKALGPEGEDQALTAPGNDVSVNGQVILEEFAFNESQNPEVKKIAEWIVAEALPKGDEYQYWRDKMPRSLVILPENAFRDFVQFSTEVITRTKLDKEKKTVIHGALWTEEHLPSDTLLYTLLYASRSRKDGIEMNGQDMLNFVKELNLTRIQLGGDETVGRGLVHLRWGGE
jgi:CRISPR-associated protein Cmr4